MGADLYIRSKFRPNNKKYETLFNKWVDVRNSFPQGSEQGAEAQKKVSEYYDKMYSQGYFRDSYNDSSLLWLLDLSWWTDVGDMLDKQGKLSVENTKALLKTVKERKPLLAKNMEKINFADWSEPKVEVIEYFGKKYNNFVAFLEEAIRLNEPIDCSI